MMNTKEAVRVLERLMGVGAINSDVSLGPNDLEALAIAVSALDELHNMAESWYCIDENDGK